jgi:hypothetical protein
VDQPDSILILLSKAQDTARTDTDTSISDCVNCSESFVVRSGCDDLRSLLVSRCIANLTA